MFNDSFIDFDSFMIDFNNGGFVLIPKNLESQATQFLQDVNFAIYQTDSPYYIAIKKL